MTAPKGQWDQLKSRGNKASPPSLLHICSCTCQEPWAEGGSGRVRRWYPSSLSSGEGERPAHTKGSLTPSHCLFLVITSTTIESMGQGEARTLVRGGSPRNNKQMFFDDNCREGKSGVEDGLVKRSLVEAVPPACCPLWSPVVVCCWAPGVRVGLLVPLPLLAKRWHLLTVAATNLNANTFALNRPGKAGGEKKKKFVSVSDDLS